MTIHNDKQLFWKWSESSIGDPYTHAQTYTHRVCNTQHSSCCCYCFFCGGFSYGKSDKRYGKLRLDWILSKKAKRTEKYKAKRSKKNWLHHDVCRWSLFSVSVKVFFIRLFDDRRRRRLSTDRSFIRFFFTLSVCISFVDFQLCFSTRLMIYSLYYN